MNCNLLNKDQLEVGLGCHNFAIAVYIANRPPMLEYQQLNQLSAVTPGEIAAIGNECGNGWRKVFNVYAKLLYALDKDKFNFSECAATWQSYRDSFLLQNHSKTALLFNPPILDHDKDIIHIIIGRTYAKSLLDQGKLDVELTWLDNEFAISTKDKLIVCPYFDYRQLSNVKIERLALMIKALANQK